MSIFNIKPTDMDNYLLCRDVGFKTAMYNYNYTKRAQTINIFWGLAGLQAFILGYRMGLDVINPFSPYQWMADDFYIYQLNGLKGGDKK